MKHPPIEDNRCGPQPGEGGRFFREVEIEFLIHELKDPLAVIETGVRTLLEKKDKFGPLTPRQEKTLKRTLRSANKARTMLSSLLEIGRSEAGCFFCSSFKPVAAAYGVLLEVLDGLPGDISEQFRALTEEKTVRDFLARQGILLTIETALEDAELLQDETKFRQIVGNLIKNAMHFRKERVEIGMQLDSNTLVVAVADDGPGIDPAHHQMVFERYKQVSGCSVFPRNGQPRSGHGLGLAGALIMARCLGGDIELESTAGHGATFRLKLPMRFDMKKSDT
ncbi:MAG: HAMP domain-containing sensor histidine kinase [Desulfobacterales bacterium]